MFRLEMIFLGLWREKVKSLLLIGTSCLLIIFLGFYEHGIQKNKSQVDYIYDNIEVPMRILSNGKNQGLMIPVESLSILEESEFVKETNYSAVLNIELPQEEEADMGQYEDPISYRLIGGESYGLESGQCEIDQSFGFEVGETFQANVFRQRGLLSDRDRGMLVDFTVKDLCLGSVVLCSYQQLVTICEELGEDVILDSAEFILSDTKKLTEFREFVDQKVFQEESLVNYDYIILDGILNQTIVPLTRSIDFMNFLYPLLFVIIASIGFVLSYITGRLEKQSLFLMRSMGISKGFMFQVLFFKQVICCSIGAMIGLWILSIDKLLIYMICYLAGSMISVLRLIHTNIVEAKRE